MIIIRIQDLVLLYKNLPKIPLKSAKCMPRCWKYSQICCDVALAGIEFGNWTCELCSESCILHSDYPLNRVNQTLYFVFFSYHLSIEFLHTPTKNIKHWWRCRQVGDYNEKHVTRSRYSTIYLPKENFGFDCKKKNILHRLCIFFHEIFGNGHLDQKIKLRVTSYRGETKVMTNEFY